MNKIGKSKQAVSIIVTILVLLGLFISAPAQAVTVSASLSSSSIDEGNAVTISGAVTLENNEYIPFTNFTLEVLYSNGTTFESCSFNISGQKITCDSTFGNISITQNTLEEENTVRFGYGYGTDGFVNTSFGSGYGYGYSSTTGYSPVLNYSVNWTTPSVSSDTNYQIQFKVTASGSSSYIYATQTNPTFTVVDTTKTINSFNITSPVNVAGAINETTKVITVKVPSGTSLASLTPSISITGASINPASGVARDFSSPVTYTVTANDASTQAYTVNVTAAAATQVVPDSNGTANISSSAPQVVVTSPTLALNVTVDTAVTEPTVNYTSLITNGTGTLPQTTVQTQKATVAIPASVTVTSANSSWDGVMKAPTVTTSVTLPTTSGTTKTLSSAVIVGFEGAKLSFDKGVRLLLEDQADKKVGYTRSGASFTEITNECSADSQTVGDALATDGDCKINVGDDLVIWTKHFTTFAAYTETSTSSGSSGGSSMTQSGPDVSILTDKSIYTYDTLYKGTSTLYITNSSFAANKITFTVDATYSQATFTLSNKDVSIPQTTVYNAFAIDHSVPNSAFTNAIITFKLDKSVTSDGEDVILLRLVDSVWTDVPTKLTSTDDNYYYYEARSPGLSTFAVVKDSGRDVQTTTETTEQNTTQSTNEQTTTVDSEPVVNTTLEPVTGEEAQEAKSSGLLLGLVIAIILVVAFFVFRKKN